MKASRNYLPLELFGEDRTPRLSFWTCRLPELAAQAKELSKKIAERGNRVVAAMARDRRSQAPTSLAEAWDLQLAIDNDRRHVHRLSFENPVHWTEIERIGAKVLAIERAFGTGSVVLLADSDDFTNDGHGRVRPAGPGHPGARRHPAQIVFDENHFGIAESSSVVSLARQLRAERLRDGSGDLRRAVDLAGIFGLSAAAARSDGRPACQEGPSHSGLLTLLRRNIPPRDLLAVCWQQWLSVNRNKMPAGSCGARGRDRPRCAGRAGGSRTRNPDGCFTRKDNFDHSRPIPIHAGKRHRRNPQGDHRPGGRHPLFAGGGSRRTSTP